MRLGGAQKVYGAEVLCTFVLHTFVRHNTATNLTQMRQLNIAMSRLTSAYLDANLTIRNQHHFL
jgi:hypothetical protein